MARDQAARGREIGGVVDLARLWVDQGKREEARELLAPVYGWFTEGFEEADIFQPSAIVLLKEIAH